MVSRWRRFPDPSEATIEAVPPSKTVSHLCNLKIPMTPQSTTSDKFRAPFSQDDFAAALEEQNFAFQKGQSIEGTVFQHLAEGAYVDIGGKAPAFIPLREASLAPVEDLSEVLPLQEKREFLIIREENHEGQVTLSVRQLEIQQAWDELQQMYEDGQSVDVEVTGVNKGGVTVSCLCLRGFIPRSHLLDRSDLDALVGTKLTVNFLEFDPENRKLVLSQKKAVQDTQFSQLEVGQLVQGKVSGIKPFGVFVDLDGITGLLHIKQVSQNFVDSLADVFEVDQPIAAMVIHLDATKNRISLSTKLLENYPGEILDNMSEVMASAEARAERARKKHDFA
jgi:small subunit ribosomal protein S1